MKTVLVDVEYVYRREYSFEVDDDAYERLIFGEGYAGDDIEIDLAAEAFSKLQNEIKEFVGNASDVDYSMYTADGETIIGWSR